MKTQLLFLSSSILLLLFSCQTQEVDSCKTLEQTGQNMAVQISLDNSEAFYTNFIYSENVEASTFSWNTPFDSAFNALKGRSTEDFIIDIVCGIPNKSYQDSVWAEYVTNFKKSQIHQGGKYSINRAGYIAPIDPNGDFSEVTNVGCVYISSKSQKYKLTFFMYQLREDKKWYITDIGTFIWVKE